MTEPIAFKGVLKFVVSGEPCAKQSFRATLSGHGYTPARVKAWQDAVGWAGKQAMLEHDLQAAAGPMMVRLDFYLGDRRRVDLDNLSKAVLDGLNRICWEDDQQVTALTVVKHVNGTRPRVAVEVGGFEEGQGQ